jgi:hypothetical protein
VVYKAPAVRFRDGTGTRCLSAIELGLTCLMMIGLIRVVGLCTRLTSWMRLVRLRVWSISRTLLIAMVFCLSGRPERTDRRTVT